MIRGAIVILVAALAAACQRGKPVDATVAIEHVTLIDGTDRGARPDMTVAIVDDRIVAVGPSVEITLGQVENRVDGKGMYLIPGLWDMHVHLMIYKEHALPLFLASGVTTIREVGGDLKEVGWIRQEVKAGRMMGPDVMIAGPTLDGPQVTRAIPGGRAAVPTPEAGRAMVDSLAGLDVDVIKVHSMTPRAAYFAILDEAKKKGIFVVGHVPDSVSIEEAIDSGQRTIEHDFGIAFANSPRGKELRGRLVAAEAAYVRQSDERFNVGAEFQIRVAWHDSAMAAHEYGTASAFAKAAARRQVWFDPTLLVVNKMALANEPGAWDLPELKFAPKATREFNDVTPPKANRTQADRDAGRAQWANLLKTFRELVREKAKFLAGTDVPVMPLVPGFSLHRELRLLVEAGLTPLEAIQAASRNGAQSMNQADRGTLESGKLASMVLLGADPLKDIGNLDRVRTVVLRGRLLDRATLDRMLRDAEAYARQ